MCDFRIVDLTKHSVAGRLFNRIGSKVFNRGTLMKCGTVAKKTRRNKILAKFTSKRFGLNAGQK